MTHFKNFEELLAHLGELKKAIKAQSIRLTGGEL